MLDMNLRCQSPLAERHLYAKDLVEGRKLSVQAPPLSPVNQVLTHSVEYPVLTCFSVLTQESECRISSAIPCRCICCSASVSICCLTNWPRRSKGKGEDGTPSTQVTKDPVCCSKPQNVMLISNIACINVINGCSILASAEAKTTRRTIVPILK